MYNPFVQFTSSVFADLQRDGMLYYVIQRFEWVWLEQGKGFIVSPYSDKEEALKHVSHLRKNEGKLISVLDQKHTIPALIKTGSGYRLFLNRFKDSDWKSRMLKLYRDKIIGYLRSKSPFKARENIDITFLLEHGRVLANITNREKTIKVKAIELIT